MFGSTDLHRGHFQVSLRTTQPKHYDVHNDQIDLIDIGFEEFNSCLTIARDENVVSETLQNFLRRVA